MKDRFAPIGSHDWFRPAGSRKKVAIVVFAVAVLACFISISSVHAQSCPASIDRFQLIFPRLDFSTELPVNQIRCQPGDNGGKYCQLRCAYRVTKPPPNDLVDFVTMVTWMVESPRQPFSTMCGGRVQRNVSASASRMATVTTSTSFDDIKVPETQPAIDKAVAILMAQAEQNALPCPGAVSSGGGSRGQPGNAASCAANFQKLQNLLATSSELDDQIKYLRDHKRKEQGFRDNLSFFNKLVAALNTSDYNGEMRDLVKAMRESREKRETFATTVGLNPDLDALTLARAARDLTIAKIEYIVDAPVFLGRMNDQKIFVEAEIFKLRTEMSQLQCGGNFDGSSCDLTGNWTFDSSDGERESWTFSAAGSGRYRAVKNYTSGPARMKAEAEVFSRDVVLRFFEGDATINIAGSYRFQLYEGCNSGTGESRLTGRPATTSFVPRRTASAARTLIPEKMYEIEYLGKLYPVVYQRQISKGVVPVVPIDLFYFKILETNGEHARQDGAELWGRFVRMPAMDHSDQSNVQTWAVIWIRSGGRWVADERKGAVFTIR